ncbi:enoyl-CoA hydratase/isomerase family protein [Rhodococcus fascians]|uniref:enoyl-CoA hydratase/isomerase family protein n=1 Tax=Rhodococcoides fascians TaxID=1828 RepID=UPI001960ECD7|nr:enoyl-CoA hydratase/isomerase family protein [Rhodococcus fascians]MBM7244204.1 enoyl-CoA hydratase/isomerase family protein [Rhodococcus fascians]MBY3810440.1 enoyl-CoA hydratase/isomerase family protein [Rhodococcus fascians]MBY3841937.1 enoyl-CoA hydratase/isomerase family protein [Rhodococcus fascians]MBY3844388.1 enoyl-CoA hydratase/isomerase family protein [Rhodococcus fascians]MBY3850334.1 enoyl-CoA hydratase/isomerase family protein [Rhodococcus fascians]
MPDEAAASSPYQYITTSKVGGVVTVVLDNPPVNVMSAPLLRELRNVLLDLEKDEVTKVIVFESANPEYFIAHFDMGLVDDLAAFDDLAELAPPGLNFTQAFSEQLRRQPQVSIVKLKGTARGGGSEFVLAADMCFATPDAKLSQAEILMGVIPGGGATQYLNRRIGRNRALEAILGADLFDAQTLEKYGWINRVVAHDEIDDFVNRLAANMANLPYGSISAIKRAIPPADEADGLVTENEIYFEQFARSAAGKILRGTLTAGAQTPEGERDLEGLLRAVAARVN